MFQTLLALQQGLILPPEFVCFILSGPFPVLFVSPVPPISSTCSFVLFSSSSSSSAEILILLFDACLFCIHLSVFAFLSPLCNVKASFCILAKLCSRSTKLPPFLSVLKLAGTVEVGVPLLDLSHYLNSLLLKEIWNRVSHFRIVAWCPRTLSLVGRRRTVHGLQSPGAFYPPPPLVMRKTLYLELTSDANERSPDFLFLHIPIKKFIIPHK